MYVSDTIESRTVSENLVSCGRKEQLVMVSPFNSTNSFCLGIGIAKLRPATKRMKMKVFMYEHEVAVPCHISASPNVPFPFHQHRFEK